MMNNNFQSVHSVVLLCEHTLREWYQIVHTAWKRSIIYIFLNEIKQVANQILPGMLFHSIGIAIEKLYLPTSLHVRVPVNGELLVFLVEVTAPIGFIWVELCIFMSISSNTYISVYASMDAFPYKWIANELQSILSPVQTFLCIYFIASHPLHVEKCRNWY